MSLDVIFAGIIGISGTLLGVLADHYLINRHEDQKLRVENWNKVVHEVYSPLIFDLRQIKDRGTLRQLRTLGKTLPYFIPEADHGTANVLDNYDSSNHKSKSNQIT